MDRRKVEVTSYSGYRSGEHPRSFVFEGTLINVSDIIRRWVEESVEGRQRKRCFQVKGDDGNTYMLSYSEETGEWYLE